MDTQGKVLLVKVPAKLDAAGAQAARRALEEGGGVAVSVFAALALDETYVYCREAAAARLDQAGARARALFPDAQVRLLEPACLLAGASQGQDAPWHYIVETDVLPEQEQDLNAWYDQEHLPGLAGVPGTVRAERYLCRDGSPRYHACYDLHTQETFGSPPWLAVRATDWSSRVRPAFRNTKRTMFQRVA
ncbi:DUF4286 family protein [Bordetella genomosp. 13]|uniref:DUF4286 family protein n=1 Tax=Bordetella genomosp. 13 TaxID=463040 RepID=UPI00119F24BF|nr:DUF4286 family protein [Bordetella genomosp. 13]